jgi:hypothetical protein
MKGKTLNPDKPIMGGTQQMDEAPKSKVMEAAESFFGPIGKKMDVKKTSRKLTDEEYGELVDEYGEGVPLGIETVEDAQKFVKEQKDYLAQMFQEYKMGKLDPKRGEPNRRRFLEKRADEGQISRSEAEELADMDFGENLKKIYDEAKGPGKGDEMVEALKSPGAIKSSEIIEAQLKETFPDIKLFGDETFEELLEIQRTGKHPRMKADGGRINFALGGPTNIIGAGLMTPGLGSLGGIEEEDEFADIRGQTAGFGLFGPISKGIQSIFGPKIGAAIFENYVRRPSINKGMDAIKKANDIAYAKRLELEEKLATRAALARAQEEINRMGYQDYGSGGASAETMASYEGPDGSYAGASTQDYGSGEKDGGLITMFVEKR